MFSEPQRNIEQFQVDPGMRIADLGAGSGFYTLAASKAVGQTGKVFAVDVQQDLLAKIKKEAERAGLSNIQTVWADIEEPQGTKMQSEDVHKVLITNTLFQVENKEAVIEEAHRILRPKGKLLVVDWTESHGGLGPAPDKVLTEKNCRELCEKVGFIFERQINAGAYHYGLIFKK